MTGNRIAFKFYGTDDGTGLNASIQTGGTANLFDPEIVLYPLFFAKAINRQSARIFHELTHFYYGTKDDGYVQLANPVGANNEPTVPIYELGDQVTEIVLKNGKQLKNAATFEEYVFENYL